MSHLIQASDILPATPSGLDIDAAKFPLWRPGQVQNITDVLNVETRVSINSMPVGSGKSLAYVALARATGARAAIYTATNPLLEQLVTDFPGHVELVKGRANYTCGLGGNCEVGNSAGCEMRRTPRCPAYAAYLNAVEAPVVATNYAYAMAVGKYGQGLGNRDMLIMDEGHSIPDLVCSFMAVKFNHNLERALQIEAPPRNARKYFESWVEWGAACKARAAVLLADARSAMKQGDTSQASRVTLLSNAVEAFERLEVAKEAGQSKLWAIDGTEQGSRWWYTLEPATAAPYVESILFKSVPQVLIYSATITPQLPVDLGIPNTDYTYFDYPTTFPVRNQPVYYVPTVQLSYKSTDEAKTKWVGRIDEIISQRLDRKGIIHTVSYDRIQQITSRSKYAAYMITHDGNPGSLQAALREFQRRTSGCVLVSPSVTTGYDFPGHDAEYQIVAKLPYPNLSSAIMRLRSGADASPGSLDAIAGSNYINSRVADTLSQVVGRINRRPTDKSETFIIDSAMSRFWYQNQRFFPSGFRRAYIQRATVPQPYTPSLLSQWVTQAQRGA